MLEKKTTILFLSADPSDAARLRLGKEQREIQEKLRLSNKRELFNFEIRSSIRSGDIVQALHDTQPQIVHFSGHGTGKGAICVEDELGKTMPISPEALSSLFELVSNSVNCVVLNACYSEIQAKSIAKHITHVIGMKHAIGDGAAIAFSIGFYRALGAGRNIEDAFKFGVVEVRLLNIAENLTPIILTKRGKHRTSRPSINADGSEFNHNTSAKLTILLEKDIKKFTKKEQEILIFALSRLVKIPPEQINILQVMAGSVAVILEMPIDSALRLRKMFETHDPLLAILKIKTISFADNLYNIFVKMENKDSRGGASVILYDKIYIPLSEYIKRQYGDQLSAEDLTEVVYQSIIRVFLDVSSYNGAPTDYAALNWIYSIARAQATLWIRVEKKASIEKDKTTSQIKKTILLLLMEQLPLEQIAHQLNIPLSYVRQVASQATGNIH